MGLVISLIISAVAFICVFASRRVALVFLLFFLIMFTEQGEGFTSFAGSFVHNQEFVGFLNLKLIELVSLFMWIAAILVKHKGLGQVLKYEKKIFIYCLVLMLVLFFVEYARHNTVSIADVRTILVGAVLVSVFCRLLGGEDDVVFCLRTFFFMMATRALIGLLLYVAGHGVSTPRGMAPFFWDSRQVAAFGMCILCLVAFLISYVNLDAQKRLWGKAYAIGMASIFTLTVFLSLRRSIWCIVLAGLGMILVSAKKKSVLTYVLIGYMLIFSVLVVANYDLDETNRFTRYIQSLNLFTGDFKKDSENDVHVDNVVQYSRMIEDNTGVLLFGFRGYPGNNYIRLPEIYSRKYPLGVPHNAVLRCVYSYGVFSLVPLFFLMGGAFSCARRIRRNAEGTIGVVAYGAIMFVLFDFMAALLFIPPFYTTNKGFFYTFFAIFLTRYADQAIATPATKT